MATQYVIHRLSRTGSTQDDARRLLSERPILVVADAQDRGRGRAGRTWETAPRALAVSLAWHVRWPRDAWPRLSLVAGLAAWEAVGELATEVGIKWPNDLVTGEGKVAGLLVETHEDSVVAGMGVNLWWPNPPRGYAALLPSDPGVSSVQPLAEAWADNLLRRSAGPVEEWGREEFEEHCVTIGRTVRWQPGGAGRAIGVASDGALIVETEGGIEHLRVSEVWEVRGSE